MKEYSVYVKYEVDIHGVEAKNKQACIKKVKDVFFDEHNIKLHDEEIEITSID